MPSSGKPNHITVELLKVPHQTGPDDGAQPSVTDGANIVTTTILVGRHPNLTLFVFLHLLPNNLMRSQAASSRALITQHGDLAAAKQNLRQLWTLGWISKL